MSTGCPMLLPRAARRISRCNNQVIPHVTDAIKDFVLSDIQDEDFVLCEIGGTMGDIEGLPFRSNSTARQ